MLINDIGINMRILISSVGTATSIGLIKAFKKENDYIVGMDINPYGYTAGSMLVDIFYRIPLAVDDSYLETIKDIINKEKVDIFIPINDIEVSIVSTMMNKLGCKVIIPDLDTINLVRDKYLCNKKIESLNIPVPKMLKEDNINIKRILKDKTSVGSKGIKVLILLKIFLHHHIIHLKLDTHYFQYYLSNIY